MERRRSSIEIIADVLKAGEDGVGKTEIMYSANMSYFQLQKYLGFLVARGFIDRLTAENSHFNYRITDKGSNLVESINNVLEVLEFREPDDS
ncbi:MAG TPA: DUF4364 family protein [Dehalococcoidia bacterium]|nr:DUF4364 family protein [Dehalococcoidia bacterium]